MHQLYFGKSPESARLAMNGEVLIKLQKILAVRGYYQGSTLGQMDEATHTALNAFIGSENFEERCDLVAGWIDQPVFDFLVDKFGSHDD